MTAPTTSTSTVSSASASASATSSGVTEVGEAIGRKIVFYAAAKAAGMTDSARIDSLAAQLCARFDADHSKAGLATTGAWLKSEYGLSGDAAALVALRAVQFQCPSYASLLGG